MEVIQTSLPYKETLSAAAIALTGANIVKGL